MELDWQLVFASCPPSKESWNGDFFELYHKYIAGVAHSSCELELYNTLLKPLVEFVERFNEVATNIVKVIVQEIFSPSHVPRTVHRLNHKQSSAVGILFLQTTQPSAMKQASREWNTHVRLNMDVHTTALRETQSGSFSIGVCTPLMTMVECLGFRFLAVAPVQNSMDTHSPAYIEMVHQTRAWLDTHCLATQRTVQVLVDVEQRVWLLCHLLGDANAPSSMDAVQLAAVEVLKMKDYPLDKIPWRQILLRYSLRMRDLVKLRAALPFEYPHLRVAALVEIVARHIKKVLRKECQKGGLLAVSEIFNTLFGGRGEGNIQLVDALRLHEEFVSDLALLDSVPSPLLVHQIAHNCNICFSDSFWESFYFYGEFPKFACSDIQIVVVSKCSASLEYEEGTALARILEKKRKELNHTDWTVLSSKALNLLHFHGNKFPADIPGLIALGFAYLQRGRYCTPVPKQMSRALVCACEALEHALELQLAASGSNWEISLLLGASVCELALSSLSKAQEGNEGSAEAVRLFQYGILRLVHEMGDRYVQDNNLVNYLQAATDKLPTELPRHFYQARLELEQTQKLSSTTLALLKTSTLGRFVFSKHESELNKLQTSSVVAVLPLPMWVVLTEWYAVQDFSIVKVDKNSGLPGTRVITASTMLAKWAVKVGERAKDNPKQPALAKFSSLLFTHSTTVSTALHKSSNKINATWAQSLNAIAATQTGATREHTLRQAKQKFEAVDISSFELETQLRILMAYATVSMEVDSLTAYEPDNTPSTVAWSKALELAHQLSSGLPTVVRQAKSIRPEMRMDTGLVLHTWASSLMELAKANPTVPHAHNMLADAVTKYRQALTGGTTVTIAAERLANALQVYGSFLIELTDEAQDPKEGLALAETAEAQFREQYAISRSAIALFSVAQATFKASQLDEHLLNKLDRAKEACCLLDMTVSQKLADPTMLTDVLCLYGDILFETAKWLKEVDMLSADKQNALACSKYLMAYLQAWRRGSRENRAHDGIHRCQKLVLELAKDFIIQRGVLFKQGEIVSSWKVRFFTLSNCSLSYWRLNDWERRQAGECTYPLGVIPLNSVTGMIIHEKWPWPIRLPHKQGFHLLTPQRAYHLSTPEGDAQRWISALQHILNTIFENNHDLFFKKL